jgi:hypothetical protein
VRIVERIEQATKQYYQGWFWNVLEAIFKRRLHDESNEI